MKPFVWKEGMTDEESKNGAYWERNMLALVLANKTNKLKQRQCCGWYYDTDNNWDGWKRVISIEDGSMCFHIPDDFDVGHLPQIEPNWDGHTTKEKWYFALGYSGCKAD